MIECVYFDFKLFGEDNLPVSFLSDFLVHINKFKCHPIRLIMQPLNLSREWPISTLRELLIENSHYSIFSDKQEIALHCQSRPISCKLTDFGESRSMRMETQTVASKTRNID